MTAQSHAQRQKRYRERQQASRDASHDILLKILSELRSLRDLVTKTLTSRDISPHPSSYESKSSTETLSEKSESEKRILSNGAAFDRFWSTYPEKVGKGAARTAFTKALTKTSLDQLIAGLERYKATKPVDRPWCNPATWLNQERWTDVPAANGHVNGSAALAIRTPSSKCSWPACSCSVRSKCQAVNGELHV